MASSSSKFYVFMAVWIFTRVVHSFVKLECDETNMGQHGHQSVLMCVIKPGPNDKNVKVRAVTWKKTGIKDALLFFHNGATKLEPGYQFAKSSWEESSMNVSLLITHTKVADAGVYKCEVITDSGEDKYTTNLRVKARYSTPSISHVNETDTPNAHSALICTSQGGYPKGELRWFDENEVEWTKSAKLELKEMASGLFLLISKLPLLPASTFSKYTCIVFNSSGSKEDEISFEMPPKSQELGGQTDTNPTSKVIAPVVVIGSLIVGLLLVLLVYRKRSQSPWKGFLRSQADIEEGDPQVVKMNKQSDVN